MQIRTAFPYETTREDIRIPLPDGTRLFARVWRPVSDAPVPALLEYEPGRLTDSTAPRDWQRHPWYAGHGYASIRVDARGHGNSEGTPGDAYDATEPEDGRAVVEWLAGRPWCDGTVGMFGIGRGGLSGLRVAELAPGPLKAVVSVCATDDRFDDTVGMHSRSATALAHASRPPDPAYAGKKWREIWLERLESVDPLIHSWLAHQIRDDYWKKGGGRDSRAAIRAAVLAVGGWHDPYRDTVLRLVEDLAPARVRGLIGPWAHHYPDAGLPPEPAIGFLQETLRWWDHHLKGRDTGIMAEPLLRTWIGDRWVADNAWPSPRVTPLAYRLQGIPVIVASPQHTGLDAGGFCPDGDFAELPTDQRDDDVKSACFEFPVTEAPVEILGRPRVRLRLRMESPRGQAVARLCDIAPDGSSTLVTRGTLNLSARDGDDRAEPWPPGAKEDVEFELQGIGHSFPPGHRIRLAVSSAYWPWIWPQPGIGSFSLDPEGCSLELPVRTATRDGLAFAEPEQAEPLAVAHRQDPEQRPGRLIIRDVGSGERRLEAAPRRGGTVIHPDGLEVAEDSLDTYTIEESDPLSARIRCDRTFRLHRPDPAWDVTVRTRSETSCEADTFLTFNEVTCHEGDEIVFHRTWEEHIPRTAW
ncbi:CocE/NonD family hydrolase [Streptomyces sannanensis]|uniref:CocE/NonD family hydrolase n=1 Tax=Streptomyces sannanensis TaxID=285536 RepID=A0ABP6SDI6_9ACTN